MIPNMIIMVKDWQFVHLMEVFKYMKFKKLKVYI